MNMMEMAQAAQDARNSPSHPNNVPALQGGDDEKLAAIMARNKQRADGQALDNDNDDDGDEEETVEEEEEVVVEEEDTSEYEEVIEEVSDTDTSGDNEEVGQATPEASEAAAAAARMAGGGGLTPNSTSPHEPSESSIEVFNKGQSPVGAGLNNSNSGLPPQQQPPNAMPAAYQTRDMGGAGPGDLRVNMDTGVVGDDPNEPQNGAPAYMTQDPYDQAYGNGGIQQAMPDSQQQPPPPQYGGYGQPTPYDQNGGQQADDDDDDELFTDEEQPPPQSLMNNGQPQYDPNGGFAGAQGQYDPSQDPYAYPPQQPGEAPIYQQAHTRAAPPVPPQGADTTTKTRSTAATESDNNWLTCGLCVACCLLVVALGGVGVILYFWIGDDPFDDDDDGNSTIRTVVLTPAPITPTTAPTPAPTPAPQVGSTPTTPAPTPAPATSSSEWRVTTTGTVPRSNPTDLGSSLSMAGDYLVAGEPRFGDNVVIKEGQVQPFLRPGSQEAYGDLPILTDTTEDSLERFGTSVDMILDSSNVPCLLVGATRTKGLVETNDRFGAGFYYEYDTLNGIWDAVGGTLRGNETFAETGGLLGHAIALAQLADGTKRAALGAPSSSIAQPNTLDVGRFYTYQLTSGEWVRMTSEAVEGPEGSFLGAALDFSSDGTSLGVGAPGSLPADGTGSGTVGVYTWSNNAWTPETFTSGSTGPSGASLGSTLRFIDTDTIAVGGPSFNNDQGMIRVFRRSGGSFAPLGDDITGTASNDRFGEALCAGGGRFATGRSTGEFGVYEYNSGDNQWNILGNAFTPDPNATVVACAMTEDGNTLALGTSAFQIFVYDLFTS